MNADERFMHAALHMAGRGLGRVWPNPAVGCFIVKDNRVIARARTADGGRPHAETAALEQAGAEAEGATAYVTLEPCAHEGETPSCAKALIHAKIKKAVIGTIDPDPRTAGKGIEELKNAGIEVVTGVLEPECKAINAGFIMRIIKSRPLICLKAACTGEGYLTPPEGRWISGQTALGDVHLRRRKYDAILIGIGTALEDDPMLTPRLPGFNDAPVRIVLDSDLRLPATSNLARSAGIIPLWVIYAHDRQENAKELEKVGARLLKSPRHDLGAALKLLAREGITRLMVEGGPTIHKAFMDAGLYDDISLYRSRKIESGQGEPVFSTENLRKRVAAQGLVPLKTREIEQDSLEIYRRKV
ncbi:MAG: bifunctional diaminohydroxyphosphoribosylaminopyrimidine deaminase/5-amino-6-(5-phosphoribosylamino)uracil reductase RibD [Alphaproteobacteria bacterium]|nr:bifunctional diaminohydroxyphosphoribosylaminopyrimidine deaminase/5-amino-6-(5-phosphoribosylamino)uracil reductase RibD [Alphaproteobacteria bacterium]MCB9975472.1 bifunctional diaminohydroxyphosphoribosylaminopyrimidine deaminase/5-amino-6-(5-phosphoribosylamino)uracil reductase RibD [Rhodospirillales bacterium]